MMDYLQDDDQQQQPKSPWDSPPSGDGNPPLPSQQPLMGSQPAATAGMNPATSQSQVSRLSAAPGFGAPPPPAPGQQPPQTQAGAARQGGQGQPSGMAPQTQHQNQQMKRRYYGE